MGSDDLEMLNDLFDGLEPEEQKQFVIRALASLNMKITDFGELKKWKHNHLAVDKLGLLEGVDEALAAMSN